jgi:hypothetical protein
MRRAERRLALILLDDLTIVVARGGLGLFAALQELSCEEAGVDGFGADAPLETGALFDDSRSYLMWALSGRRESYS